MKRALAAHFAYLAASLTGPATDSSASLEDAGIASRLDEGFVLPTGLPDLLLPPPVQDHLGERAAGLNRHARRAAAARARRRTP